jgi:hypothetical protein
MAFKRRLPALLLTATFGLLLSPVFAAPSQDRPAKSYSGYGSMSLKATTAYLFPGVVCKFNDVDPNLMVSWDVDSASSEAVLNAIAKQSNIEWNYENKVLVFKRLAGTNQALTPTPAMVMPAPAPQANIAPQYVRPEPAKEIAAPVSSTVPVKASLRSNEEIVEWVVKPTASTKADNSNPKPSTFEITSEDETLSLALRRWAANAGYQLAWEAGKDFAARATTYNSPDVVSAIEAVMNDTAHSNYPLHACAYDNKVIRILQIAQGCGKTNSEDKI